MNLNFRSTGALFAALLAIPSTASAQDAAPATDAAPAEQVAPAAATGTGASTISKGGPFAPKASREAFPAREVERSLMMPKGWLELQVGYSRKVGIGAWTADGERDEFENTLWLYNTQRATVRYGLAPRWELWWSVPWHQARLTNSQIGTDIQDGSVGDPRVGARYELLDTQAPATSVALELAYKGPAGNESPGTYIGGPQNVSGFVFTTGTPDLSVGIGAKKQLGPAAVTAHIGYVRRFSAVVQYLVETENYQFLGRIKPGDQAFADIEIAMQAGPVVLYGGPRIEARAQTSTGTTSAGWNPARNLQPIADSAGTAADLNVGLLLNATRGVDFGLHALLPVAGEDLQFFPIEDLQPTLGPTYGATLELRY